ncbi:MAG: hypothetical protein GYB31_15440 [Bacteroidetes bacterium]|nr:hypothetical protein [Bacteroidota bacterium]
MESLSNLVAESRALLREDGLAASLDCLDMGSNLLSANLQDELESFFLRKRDLETQNRQNLLTPDSHAVLLRKLEKDFLGFLRSLESKQPRSVGLSAKAKEKIESLIFQGRLNTAFREIKAARDQVIGEKSNQISLLLADWESFRKDVQMGILDYNTQTTRQSQLTNRLLQLMD